MIAALLALTLHVGDVELVAREQQITSPAIHVKTHSGDIYHVPIMPLDGGIFDGTEHLVYEENTINTCQTFELPAGIYRAELRGGSGGKPYRCAAGTGTMKAPGEYVSSVFKLNDATMAYALRGGDGNNSPTVTIHQIPGGGASGVDSILVIGDRTIRANGGPGARCMNDSINSYYKGGQGIASKCSGGGGGNYSQETINNAGDTFAQSFVGCAGGGGGANAYGGGSQGNAKSNTKLEFTSGTPGTTTGGGNGGNATNLLGTSMTKNNAVGGTGGKNVTYSCGGKNAVSYGGGGGGASCALRLESSCTTGGSWCESDCADGGAGASGSTGTSETSFIKIYKIG